MEQQKPEEKIRLYLIQDDFTDDERICDLIGELGGQNLDTTLELIERCVQVANSHIWGTFIMLVQQGESEK